MRCIQISAVIAIVTGCAFSQAQAQSMPVTDTALYRLIDSDWEFQKRHSLALAQFSGDRKWMHSWPDLSRSAIRALGNHNRELLAKLRNIDLRSLSIAGRIDYRVFGLDLHNRTEEIATRAYLSHFWQFERFGPSALRWLNFVASEPPPLSIPEMQARIVRLRRVPDYVSQQIQLMRESRQRRMMPPQEAARTALASVELELAAEPAKSVFYRSFASSPLAGREPGATTRLDAARRTIVDHVKPALKSLRTFLEKEYLPHCPTSPSISFWPNGAEFYRLLVRLSTTTNLSPDEVHATGVAEVARVQREIEEAVRATGYAGSVEDFTAAVRSDEQFYYKTENELLQAYRSTVHRIAPYMPKLFRTIPEAPLAIEARKFGASGPGASYMPGRSVPTTVGTVLVNVSNPELRPKYEMLALMLHEGLPGHHLQRSVDTEQQAGQDGRVASRRLRQSNAFIEGWGLYSERLGYDVGLYSDPYERFGQLTYEMVRAVRMVIDTGLHAKGWSRERAVQYFVEHTGKPKAIAEGEIQRAIWDPGSLLSYKVGELIFSELRHKAAVALGEKFDIRKFHDFLLAQGPLPLNILQEEFTTWLEAQAESNTAG